MASKTLVLVASLSLIGCAFSRSTDVVEDQVLMCGTMDSMYPEPRKTLIEVASADSSVAFDWQAVADSVYYPEFARRAKIEGTVTSSVVITPEGRAVAAWVVRSPNDLLSEAAEDALMKARYAPAPEYQKSVSIEVKFRLR